MTDYGANILIDSSAAAERFRIIQLLRTPEVRERVLWAVRYLDGKPESQAREAIEAVIGVIEGLGHDRKGPAMNKACLYHRVSTFDQDPTLARDELAAVARARGLEVVASVEETGSGRKTDRPGLRQVMDLARKGAISHVLVWKLDRFGRNALDLLSNVQELERSGVTFVATSQGVEVGPNSGPMGRCFLTILAALAEWERATIVERVHLGLAKARKLGRRPGPRPSIPARAVERAAVLRGAGYAWSTVGALLETEGLGTHARTAIERAVVRSQRKAA